VLGPSGSLLIQQLPDKALEGHLKARACSELLVAGLRGGGLTRCFLAAPAGGVEVALEGLAACIMKGLVARLFLTAGG